jgi:hypothetical protein
VGFLYAGLGALAAAGWLILRYRALRKLARERNAAFEALAEALAVRHELTLELVRLASGYLVLEAPLLEAVALSRYYAMQARSVLARTKTETDLCWALARLMLAAEGHPELTSHPRFLEAVREVAAAEDQAAALRERYNAAAEALARALKGPSGAVLGRVAHVDGAQLFELDPTVARQAMMTLLTPRQPETPDRPLHPVPPLASVAFGV